MDHQLDLTLIRLHTWRPPWGFSTEQSHSSWRNPPVKNDSHWENHSDEHVKKDTHTDTQAQSLRAHNKTHNAEFERLMNADAIAIGNPKGFKRAISQRVGIRFSLQVAPVLEIDDLPGE